MDFSLVVLDAEATPLRARQASHGAHPQDLSAREGGQQPFMDRSVMDTGVHNMKAGPPELTLYGVCFLRAHAFLLAFLSSYINVHLFMSIVHD